jgi:carboxymethylenebutenolidase
VSQLVDYPSNGNSAQGQLALPPSGGGPGVVLIQEWWGLVPHIVDMAERLAGEGFVVLAPDLYHGESTTEPDEARKQLMTLDIPRAGRDIAGAAAYLLGREETTGSTVGVIGFCMGGSLALWAGTITDAISVAAPFYPGMPWAMLAPDWSAYAGKHVQMHLAESDGGSGADGVQEARDAIVAAGGDVTLFDYPGSHHAFMNDTRPEVHDPEHAATAWERTVAFLRQHLSA